MNGEGRKSRKGSTTELLTPNSARSDIYSIEVRWTVTRVFEFWKNIDFEESYEGLKLVAEL